MIAQELEKRLLFQVQRQSTPSLKELPGYQNDGFEIDLNTRTISSPEFLSVERDHHSEVIYFVINRYHDYMDLSQTICVIQFINAKNEQYIYAVPWYDTYTLKDSQKMIIPWNISGAATVASGEITYSFRFYKIEDGEAENGDVLKPVEDRKVIYNLNTIPATSKILHGLEVTLAEEEKIDFPTTAYTTLLNEINKISERPVYWTMLDD